MHAYTRTYTYLQPLLQDEAAARSLLVHTVCMRRQLYLRPMRVPHMCSLYACLTCVPDMRLVCATPASSKPELQPAQPPKRRELVSSAMPSSCMHRVAYAVLPALAVLCDVTPLDCNGAAMWDGVLVLRRAAPWRFPAGPRGLRRGMRAREVLRGGGGPGGETGEAITTPEELAMVGLPRPHTCCLLATLLRSLLRCCAVKQHSPMSPR